MQRWAGFGAGMAAVPGRQLSRLIQTNDVILAFTGHMIDREGIRRKAERLAPVFSGAAPGLDPALVTTGTADALLGQLLAIYHNEGPEGLAGWNGKYVISVWDIPNRSLTIVNDRLGFEPFYTWQANSTAGPLFVFASTLRSISRHPKFEKIVDPVSVVDLLAAGQMQGERTLFEAVRALPAATLLTFQEGQLGQKVYWQPAFYVPGSRAPGEAEALDGLAQAVSAAVDRSLASVPREVEPSVLELLLTGGLDSRLLAGELVRRQADHPGGVQVRASTIGHSRAYDTRFGREIARVSGLPYTVIPVNPRYMAEYAEECLTRTEGRMNLHAAWILGETGHLTSNHIPLIMTGVGGEGVSGRSWLADQETTDLNAALELLVTNRWKYREAAALMAPGLRQSTYLASRETIRQALWNAPAQNLLNRFDLFFYWHNRRHPTGSVLQEEALVLEPFFDQELIDYVFSVPPEMRTSGKLYRQMIARQFPRLADIGIGDVGRYLRRSSAVVEKVIDLVNHQAFRIQRRLARSLPFLLRAESSDPPSNTIYYNHWLRTEMRSFVEQQLVEGADNLSSYLDAERVRSLALDHLDGRVNDFRTIGGLLTFAVWLQMFC